MPEGARHASFANMSSESCNQVHIRELSPPGPIVLQCPLLAIPSRSWSATCRFRHKANKLSLNRGAVNVSGYAELDTRRRLRDRLLCRGEEIANAQQRRQPTNHPRRPRHADGENHAPLLDAGAAVVGAARARLSAGARQIARRGTRRLPRHRRNHRHDRGVLPEPARVAVARPQRGKRTSLRLSRLEIRHRRALRRTDERAPRVRRQGPHHRLPHC